ncbi:MAG TPA: hypothetical protein VNT55_01510 [Baekduia sp.]|nr:hypothetical protein [Baekduia sp.]
MTIGMSTFSADIVRSRSSIALRSGEPGSYDRTGSLNGGGTDANEQLLTPASNE